MRRMDFQDAETKLIITISYLVYIIPLLALVELAVQFYTNTLSGWTASPFVGLLEVLIFVVVILKIINVIDSNLNKYWESKNKSDY